MQITFQILTKLDERAIADFTAIKALENCQANLKEKLTSVLGIFCDGERVGTLALKSELTEDKEKVLFVEHIYTETPKNILFSLAEEIEALARENGFVQIQCFTHNRGLASFGIAKRGGDALVSWRV